MRTNVETATLESGATSLRGDTVAQPRMRPTQIQEPIRGEVTPKIARFFQCERPKTPCLVVDLDIVEHNFRTMRRALAPAKLYYAVKANPDPAILGLLAQLGSCFDAASRHEIDSCLAQGVRPDQISFGNTVKKLADIAYAYDKGIRLFVFDCQNELDKLAKVAPGARVFCRVLVDTAGADWPLARKSGCSPAMALDLMTQARARGLDACGLSFHVGSQQTELPQWERAIAQIADLYNVLRDRGIELDLINLGGGFPGRYHREVPPVDEYCEDVMRIVRRHFMEPMPELIVEPGRGIVGDAGVIEAEVVLISKKDDAEEARWIFLDIGVFSGLAETVGEAIKYRIQTVHDGGPAGPVVIAGPTCDSIDILYERFCYQLPLALRIGDRVRLLSSGAYTTSTASIGFNGFAPVASYYI
jgi:ornithine decarboxylase